MNQLLGLAGVAAIILIAVVFSSNRKAIRLRIVGAAFALQAVIAFLVIRTSGGRAVIQGMSDGVASLLSYATKGTEFLFGPTDANPLAHTFAIAALPVIVFFASLVAILYHLGIMGSKIHIGQIFTVVLNPYHDGIPVLVWDIPHLRHIVHIR